MGWVNHNTEVREAGYLQSRHGSYSCPGGQLGVSTALESVCAAAAEGRTGKSTARARIQDSGQRDQEPDRPGSHEGTGPFTTGSEKSRRNLSLSGTQSLLWEILHARPKLDNITIFPSSTFTFNEFLMVPSGAVVITQLAWKFSPSEAGGIFFDSWAEDMWRFSGWGEKRVYILVLKWSLILGWNKKL